jgi:hypothetical protein
LRATPASHWQSFPKSKILSHKDGIVSIIALTTAIAILGAALKFGLAAWLCVPICGVYVVSVRPLLRKITYNDLDRIERQLRSGSEIVRQAALKQLSASQSPRAADLVANAMRNDVPDLQIPAAAILLRKGDDRATKFLQKAMKSSNTSLRDNALTLLRESSWTPTTVEAHIARWVAVGDFSCPVSGGVSAVVALKAGLSLNKVDTTARTRMVQALAAIGTQDVVEPLLTAMQKDTAKAVKHAAREGLKHLARVMNDSQTSAFSELSAQLALDEIKRERARPAHGARTPTTPGSSRPLERPARPAIPQAQPTNVGTLNERLFKAAEDGKADVIQALISQGADVNARNGKEATPLHYAAMNGHLSAVMTLLGANADVHAHATKGPRLTPLHLAAGGGHSDVINALLDRDATQVTVGDVEGDTPLHYAALGAQNIAVKTLLARNANPIGKSANGRTPISVAAEGCLQANTGHVETIKLLTAQPTKELESVLDSTFCRFWGRYSATTRSTLNEILEEVRRKIK